MNDIKIKQFKDLSNNKIYPKVDVQSVDGLDMKLLEYQEKFPIGRNGDVLMTTQFGVEWVNLNNYVTEIIKNNREYDYDDVWEIRKTSGDESSLYKVLDIGGANRVGNTFVGSLSGHVTQPWEDSERHSDYVLDYSITYNEDKTLTISGRFTWSNPNDIVGLDKDTFHIGRDGNWGEYVKNDEKYTPKQDGNNVEFEIGEVVTIKFGAMYALGSLSIPIEYTVGSSSNSSIISVKKNNTKSTGSEFAYESDVIKLSKGDKIQLYNKFQSTYYGTSDVNKNITFGATSVGKEFILDDFTKNNSEFYWDDVDVEIKLTFTYDGVDKLSNVTLITVTPMVHSIRVLDEYNLLDNEDKYIYSWIPVDGGVIEFFGTWPGAPMSRDYLTDIYTGVINFNDEVSDRVYDQNNPLYNKIGYIINGNNNKKQTHNIYVSDIGDPDSIYNKPLDGSLLTLTDNMVKQVSLTINNNNLITVCDFDDLPESTKNIILSSIERHNNKINRK